MAPVYRTLLRTIDMVNSENVGSWGDEIDATLDALENAIAGATTITTTGGSTTLSTNNNAADEARRMILLIGGTLTANAVIFVPDLTKTYAVYNGTSGAFTLEIRTPSLSGVTIDQGEAAHVFVDTGNQVRMASIPATASGQLGTSRIANNAVTLAKLANMTGAGFLGATAAGAVTELTVAQALGLISPVEYYATQGSFPAVGDAAKLYIAEDTGFLYRWNAGTTAYVQVGASGTVTLADINGDLDTAGTMTAMDLDNDRFIIHDDSLGQTVAVTPRVLLNQAGANMSNIAAIDTASDRVFLYDASGAVMGWVTPAQISGAVDVNGLTAETVDVDLTLDKLLMYDASEAANNSITPQEFFDHSFQDLANVAAPDGTNDLFPIYDASGAVARHVKFSQMAATPAEVDAGTVTDKYVSPSTNTHDVWIGALAAATAFAASNTAQTFALTQTKACTFGSYAGSTFTFTKAGTYLFVNNSIAGINTSAAGTVSLSSWLACSTLGARAVSSTTSSTLGAATASIAVSSSEVIDVSAGETWQLTAQSDNISNWQSGGLFASSTNVEIIKIR